MTRNKQRTIDPRATWEKRQALVREQNAWRRQRIDRLVLAAFKNDDEAFEKALRVVRIPGSSPTDTGFSLHDLEHFAKVFESKLYGFDQEDGSHRFGLCEVKTHKSEILGRINKRAAEHGGQVKSDHIQRRNELAAAIKEIQGRINAYQRVVMGLWETLDARAHGKLQPEQVPAVVTEEAPA